MKIASVAQWEMTFVHGLGQSLDIERYITTPIVT